MAQKIRVELVCDACEDGRSAQRTLSFGFDDETGAHRNYQVELCARHLAQFVGAIDPWVSLGRPAEPAPAPSGRSGRLVASSTGALGLPGTAGAARKLAAGRRPARRDPEQLAGIRIWARANGYTVSDRGRLPAEVEEAYNLRSESGATSGMASAKSVTGEAGGEPGVVPEAPSLSEPSLA